MAEASEDVLRRLSEHQSFVLGTVTGSVEQGLSQPLLYWKNSFQQGLPFTLNPKVLYRGTFASVSNTAAMCGFQFFSAGVFQKIIAGSADAKMTFSQEVAAAFLGGASSGPLCCTLELTMIQQQNFGGSFYGTVARILKTHGPGGMMRGVVCSTGREAVFTAGYLGIVPAMNKYSQEQFGKDSYMGNVVGGVGGGLACAALSQPLDTAKTCMQGDLERRKYQGTLQTLRTLHTEYGSVAAIYRGYWWRAFYVMESFFVFDFLKQRIAPILYPC